MRGQLLAIILHFYFMSAMMSEKMAGSGKEWQAKSLMTACSDQYPDCPTISTSEIIVLLRDRNSHKNHDKHADKSNHVESSVVSDNSVILVDVRSAVERKLSMIPGAITAEEFETMFKKDLKSYQSRLIIPYCTIGFRSGKYGTNLKKSYGFTNVRNGEGIILWTHSSTSHLVTKVGGVEVKTTDVHTFGSAWDLAADHYDTVQFGTFLFLMHGVTALFRH